MRLENSSNVLFAMAQCDLVACLRCGRTMNFQFRYKYIEINFNENLNPITLAKYFCCHVVLRSTAHTPHIQHRLQTQS